MPLLANPEAKRAECYYGAEYRITFIGTPNEVCKRVNDWIGTKITAEFWPLRMKMPTEQHWIYAIFETQAGFYFGNVPPLMYVHIYDKDFLS